MNALKIIFSFSFFILISSITFSQTPENKGVAKIHFEEESFDFGDIYQGDVVQHTFILKNTGSAPLLLTNVATTCGCTAPNWSREPILPGKESEILVKFDSRGKSGIQNKIITIYSNAETPQTRVKITTNVLPAKQN
ncbi:DUF1573 domain-containing protein [Flexithrix dorotheae]|uniref:DUF1573 domain-containing protein n=1 Tax=Flexithrix dorotheae TaxID=70993 RepID=UPI000360CB6C|nr:DUF1573 domain-containing protein [Flexithrix dorotheae]